MKYDNMSDNKHFRNHIQIAIAISIFASFTALLFAAAQNRFALIATGIVMLVSSFWGMWSAFRLERNSIPLAQLLGVGILSLSLITSVVIIVNALG